MSIFNTIAGGLKVADTLFGNRNSNRSSGASNTNQNTTASGSEDRTALTQSNQNQTSSTNQNTSQSSTLTGDSTEAIRELLESITNRSSTASTTGTTTENRTDTGTQSTNEQQRTQDNMTQAARSTGSESTRQTTFGFDQGVMAQLNTMLQGVIQGGGFQGSSDALAGRLATVSGGDPFNVDGFVSGIMQQATSTATGELESRINQTASAIGGNERGNSMAALLNNRLRNDTAANLAGIEANARMQGMQTRAGESDEIGRLAVSGAESTLGLIQSIAGGQSEAVGQAQTELAENTQRDQDRTAGITSDMVSTGNSAIVGSSTQEQIMQAIEQMTSDATSTADRTQNQTEQQTGTMSQTGTQSSTASELATGNVNTQQQQQQQTNTNENKTGNTQDQESRFRELFDLFTASAGAA